MAIIAPGATTKRSRSSTTRPSYAWRTPASSSMAAALKQLQRDVHDQRHHHEDDAESEGEAEIPLRGREGDGRRERAGRAADVAPDDHGGPDFGDHLSESGGDDGGERGARPAPPPPPRAPPAGAPRL